MIQHTNHSFLILAKDLQLNLKPFNTRTGQAENANVFENSNAKELHDTQLILEGNSTFFGHIKSKDEEWGNGLGIKRQLAPQLGCGITRRTRQPITRRTGTILRTVSQRNCSMLDYFKKETLLFWSHKQRR